MLKWLLTLVLVVIIVGLVVPWLARRDLRRLPGDARVTARGREFYFPFVSAALASLLFAIIFRLFN
jgi:uncharacterized membrane-anchored protein